MARVDRSGNTYKRLSDEFGARQAYLSMKYGRHDIIGMYRGKYCKASATEAMVLRIIKSKTIYADEFRDIAKRCYKKHVKHPNRAPCIHLDVNSTSSFVMSTSEPVGLIVNGVAFSSKYEMELQIEDAVSGMREFSLICDRSNPVAEIIRKEREELEREKWLLGSGIMRDHLHSVAEADFLNIEFSLFNLCECCGERYLIETNRAEAMLHVFFGRREGLGFRWGHCESCDNSLAMIKAEQAELKECRRLLREIKSIKEENKDEKH